MIYFKNNQNQTHFVAIISFLDSDSHMLVKLDLSSCI